MPVSYHGSHTSVGPGWVTHAVTRTLGDGATTWGSVQLHD
jgi:hypothetical protein